MQKKIRVANLDLLRIFSMFLIILLHSIDHSGVLEAATKSGLAMNGYIKFLYFMCQICVNCYVLLSGYFLVNSKFKLEKLIYLWIEVVFYSLVIKLIFMIIGTTPFSLTSLVSCFIPITTGRYWFITIYFGLYLIFPFLNIAIKNMNKEQHGKLNLILIFLFSILISISPVFAGMNSGGAWGLPWFIVLYFIASWFRLYYKPNKNMKRRLLCYIFILLLITGITLISERHLFFIQNIVKNIYRYDHIFSLICSLLVFSMFLDLKINNLLATRIISKMAPLTLGVYLIHAHAELDTEIWDWLGLLKHINSIIFPFYQLLIVLMILFVCMFIDYIRDKIFDFLNVRNICKKIQSLFYKCLNHYIRQKLF